MFLAWKEIKHSKGRYILIIGVILLISYLTLFLTGLAYGLAQDGRLAVDKWNATGIVLTKEANNNLNLSQFNSKDINDITAEKKATLIQQASIAQLVENKSNKTNVSLFGINKKQFITPKIIKGHIWQSDDEVVISNKLASYYKFKIGDKIKLTGSNHQFKIVGVSANSMFNVTPVIYMSTNGINSISNNLNNPNINAIVVKTKDNKLDNIKLHNNNLKIYSIKDFINNLPGYSAQVMTFELMIGSLIIIAAVILGIFIYILTLQKKHIFGVMKVQGISASFIARSVILQTALLAIIGVVLGGGLVLITQTGLPQTMPFSMNLYFYLGISILMILFAVIGSLFSIKSIIKIDPLEALA